MRSNTKKYIEKILIFIALAFAFLSVISKTFHIQGSWFVLLSFFTAIIFLAIYYTFTTPSWQVILLQAFLILGMVQFFFKINHYPMPLHFPLFNISLLLFPYFIIVSPKMNKIANLDKYFLYAISISFFLYGILTLSPKLSTHNLGIPFLLIHTALIILYFFLRKEKEFFLEDFLKTVAVTGLCWLIMHLEKLLFIGQEI